MAKKPNVAGDDMQFDDVRQQPMNPQNMNSVVQSRESNYETVEDSYMGDEGYLNAYRRQTGDSDNFRYREGS